MTLCSRRYRAALARVHDALIEARYCRERGKGWLATRLAEAAEDHLEAAGRVEMARAQLETCDPGLDAARGVPGFDWPEAG